MRTILVISVGGAAAALLLAGCGQASRPADHAMPVVAAENVYGDIASQIGGDRVHVTSLISNPNADPHLFEPTTASELATAQARVAIANGLGYDAFLTKLETATPTERRIEVTIADALGVRGADANPHLWYDVPRLPLIGAAIAGALQRADPADAHAYRAGLRRFDRSLAPLRREVARIRARFHGARVAYTEPVPDYLVAAAGLRNLTPPAFARAIEEGSEPTPAAFAAMDALVEQHRIQVLLYDSQAPSPVADAIESVARRAGIPVVAVTETLPAGLSFQAWQLRQARALEGALAR